MLKFKSRLTATAVLTLTCLAAAPAKATTPVTYVSGKGTDAGDCSSAAKPCRTFQFAVNQTSLNGEVKALDPADYRAVVVNKSLSLTGVDGAGIDANGGVAIAITTSNGAVYVANLILQNVGGGNSGGISAQGLGGSQLSVTISHCVVRGFNWGISMAGPGINVMIADTIVTNNTQVGISVTFGGAILDHVTVKQSINGIIIGHGGVTLIDSLVANNSFSGVLIESSSLTIAHSTVTGNKYGLNTIPTVGHINSFGDNHVYGNGTDVVEGTLTNVGTK